MRRMGQATVVAAVSAVGMAGCGHHGHGGLSASSTWRTQGEAQVILQHWQALVQKGAAQDPKPRFDQADPATIRRLVQRNATRFHYEVRRAEVISGRAGAPLVAVRVESPDLEFTARFPALWRGLDPNSKKYEGFYFEAVDASDVPFLVVWNAWRELPRGGGQWAPSDDLFPFAHSTPRD